MLFQNDCLTVGMVWVRDVEDDLQMSLAVCSQHQLMPWGYIGIKA